MFVNVDRSAVEYSEREWAREWGEEVGDGREGGVGIEGGWYIERKCISKTNFSIQLPEANEGLRWGN